MEVTMWEIVGVSQNIIRMVPQLGLPQPPKPKTLNPNPYMSPDSPQVSGFRPFWELEA